MTTDDRQRLIARIVCHAAALSRESLTVLAEVATDLADQEGVTGPSQVLTPQFAEVKGAQR